MEEYDWYLLATCSEVSADVAKKIKLDRDTSEVLMDPSRLGKNTYLLVQVNKGTGKTGYRILREDEAAYYQNPNIKIIVNH